MSTERKPGSRGVMEPTALERVNQPPLNRIDQPLQPDAKKKNSTKTVSPSKSFKKRPRK